MPMPALASMIPSTQAEVTLLMLSKSSTSTSGFLEHQDTGNRQGNRQGGIKH